MHRLAQGGVFRFSFLIDGHVGISVFPKRQKIFIRFSRRRRVVREDLSTSQLQFGKSTSDETCHDAGMIENFSKLGCCKVPSLELEISKTSKVSRRHTGEIVAGNQVVWRYRPQNFNCSRRVIFVELYRSSRRRQSDSFDCKVVEEELIQLPHQFLGLFYVSCASEC